MKIKLWRFWILSSLHIGHKDTSMYTNNDIIVGLAGHIDHGKTTLIKALNGFDGDSLLEEKQRGITLDLRGIAHLLA